MIQQERNPFYSYQHSRKLNILYLILQKVRAGRRDGQTVISHIFDRISKPQDTILFYFIVAALLLLYRSGLNSYVY